MESMEKIESVTTRKAVPSDKNFILATFLRGLYYGNPYFKEIDKDVFMKNYHDMIDKLISLPQIVTDVVCLKDDPDTILSYSIKNLDGSLLHWVFTKSAWRGIGLAKLIVPPTVKEASHFTKVGLELIHKKHLKFNPFKLF